MSLWPFLCTPKKVIKGKREDSIVNVILVISLFQKSLDFLNVQYESQNRHGYFYEGVYAKDQIHSPSNDGVIWEIGIHLV